MKVIFVQDSHKAKKGSILDVKGVELISLISLGFAKPFIDTEKKTKKGSK